MKTVKLASGASWARDRFEPAVDLVERGGIDYICFDAMSEVTMSMAQTARMHDPNVPPYDPYLRERIRPILKTCMERGIRIVTNGGWLDPLAAADEVLRIADELGITGVKVAAVTGSVISDKVKDLDLTFVEDGKPVSGVGTRLIVAEAYLGAEGIIEALDKGANVVVTGRIGDACMYLGPLAYEFGWSIDNHHAMAKGMIIGHLMECGTQISGGCFADPGYKEVPDIAELGHPIVEVSSNSIVITKLAGTGGVVTPATCKEQLLYEVQDPANYYCPDVVADMTKVAFRQVGPDRVEVLIDDAGRPKTPTLKALIGVNEGFIAEEMILFAGPGALKRAQLTEKILRARIAKINLDVEDMRVDFIGINGVHREATPTRNIDPYELILRIAIKTRTREEAMKLGREVDPIAVNGPAGVGKWGTHSPGTRVRAVVGLNSALVSREQVPFSVIVRG